MDCIKSSSARARAQPPQLRGDAFDAIAQYQARRAAGVGKTTPSPRDRAILKYARETVDLPMGAIIQKGGLSSATLPRRANKARKGGAK